MVRLHTNFGPITLELDHERAPKTAANFESYVRSGFYDGTVFHRVINGFMIQGGGFEPGMRQKTTEAPIENEARNGLRNAKYTVAMARTGDPHSGTSQFYVNLTDNIALDPSPARWGYAVFGRVVEGMEVVDRIASVATGSNAALGEDVPLQPVVITTARVVGEAATPQ